VVPSRLRITDTGTRWVTVADACQLNLMSQRSSVMPVPDRSGVRSSLRAWMCRLVGTTIPSKIPSPRIQWATGVWPLTTG
jgi:hypothetical protein